MLKPKNDLSIVKLLIPDAWVASIVILLVFAVFIFGITSGTSASESLMVSLITPLSALAFTLLRGLGAKYFGVLAARPIGLGLAYTTADEVRIKQFNLKKSKLLSFLFLILIFSIPIFIHSFYSQLNLFVMDINQPFFFAIQDSKTNEPLFMGVINNPEEK